MSRFPVILPATLFAAALIMSGCRSTSSTRDQSAERNSPQNDSRRDDGDEQALQRRARAMAHYGAGVVHEFSEQTREALNEFYLAAKEDPDNEDLLLDVSNRLIDGRAYDRALELLEPRAMQEDASGVLTARLGFVYSQLGKSAQAIEANRAALRKLPRSLQATQNLYVNYLQTKQPEAALKVLDDAAALSESSPDFLISLAELYSNYELQFPAQRDSLRAKQLAVLHRAEKHQPLPPSIQIKLADGLNGLGDHEGARKAYTELLRFSEAPPGLLALARAKLADILLRSDDRAGAAEQLKAIVQDDPSNAAAHFFLGQFAMEKQKWVEAAEHFQKVLIFNPNFEQAYYELARAQVSSSDYTGAIATLDTARGKYSSNFTIEFLCGVARNGLKNYAEAVRHFTRAEIVARATDEKRLTAGFYFQFGATLERSGDRDEAAKCFEKCLQIEPDDAEALNYLGYMWAEQGINLDRARDMISRALKIEPDNDAFLDSMGWVLFKLNQPEAALEYLLKAVAKTEKPDATLLDHLGDIHAALKQNDKAREAWRKSLEIESNDMVKKKLESITAPETK